MKITEKTVFPIFTKGNNHYYCLLFDMAIVFGKTDFSIVREYKKIRNQDEEITKEEFIEANNALLEKTGLINLFEPNFPKSYVDDLLSLVQEKDKQNSELVEKMSNQEKWITRLETLSEAAIADSLRYKALIDKFIL